MAHAQTTGQDQHCRQRCWHVLEEFTLGKHPDPSKNEDAVVITPHFAAVLDGVTDKPPPCAADAIKPGADRESPGRFAARVAASALRHTVNPEVTFREAIDVLTSELDLAHRCRMQAEECGDDMMTARSCVETKRIDDDKTAAAAANSSSAPPPSFPTRPAVGALVVYSAEQNEVWRLGDGTYRIDSDVRMGSKAIDALTSEARSARLEMALLSGEASSVEDLRRQDVGRECILPLLRNQSALCNREDGGGKYGYGCLDGRRVPDRYLEVTAVPPRTREVVLATDGYPEVHGTLAESETALREILREDPLLFRRYKSTKGLLEGNNSFDDRSYIRISFDNAEDKKQ